MQPGLADAPFCYLTTTGRITREPRTIEIWFALCDQTIYLLSGNREYANWVKNAIQEPRVTIRIDHTSFSARARLVQTDTESMLARRLVREKYATAEEDLEQWSRSAMPIAFDIGAPI